MYVFYLSYYPILLQFDIGNEISVKHKYLRKFGVELSHLKYR